MKLLLATLAGMDITILTSFLFNGGVAPVERYIYNILFRSNGLELLYWLPICYGAGLIILNTFRIEGESES